MVGSKATKGMTKDLERLFIAHSRRKQLSRVKGMKHSPRMDTSQNSAGLTTKEITESSVKAAATNISSLEVIPKRRFLDIIDNYYVLG